jgi:hypothetical protein
MTSFEISELSPLLKNGIIYVRNNLKKILQHTEIQKQLISDHKFNFVYVDISNYINKIKDNKEILDDILLNLNSDSLFDDTNSLFCKYLLNMFKYTTDENENGLHYISNDFPIYIIKNDISKPLIAKVIGVQLNNNLIRIHNYIDNYSFYFETYDYNDNEFIFNISFKLLRYNIFYDVISKAFYIILNRDISNFYKILNIYSNNYIITIDNFYNKKDHKYYLDDNIILFKQKILHLNNKHHFLFKVYTSQEEIQNKIIFKYFSSFKSRQQMQYLLKYI